MRNTRIAVLTAAATLAVSGAAATAASAAFDQMKVTEVHQGPGVPTASTGDFIELQMYAAGQNLVGGHYVRTYDGGSAAFSTYQITSDVANGQTQRTVLIANDASTTGADFIVAGGLNVINANGGVCYLDNLLGSAIDCVSWGSPVGTLPSPSGTPLALPADTIPDNGSISRRITPNCATLLEAADDTNVSNTDFALATPSPRPNATAPTEVACQTPANPAPTSPDAPKTTKCKKKKKKKGKKSASAAAKKKGGCKKKKRKK